jgi:amino acid transporter
MANESEAADVDLGADRQLKGRRLGDRRVRVQRPHAEYFRYTGQGTLVAKAAASRPRTATGRFLARSRRVLFGRPLSIHEEIGERTGVVTGLALFASDNISSSAYATEEIMRVLVLAGAGALALTMPITIAIVFVLAIVVISYRQTIKAYPNGGGSYVVASENLGPIAGLTAAGALLTDYVLTVAVSVAAGVAALTSIWPELFDYRVALGVGLVAVIAFINLRGIRESGLVFSVPTYVYFVSIFGLLLFGLIRFASGTMPDYIPPAGWNTDTIVEPLGLLLILRAFSSGAVALTGTEAVSNGVPAFKPPEVRNAQTVIMLMGTGFAIIFLGIGFLGGQLGIVPDPSEQETVLSQITRTFVGTGPYYLLVQIATALLLILAANTSFNGFPRLAGILARDGYLPRFFQFRGDRLAFNTGIVLLALISALLIWGFSGSVSALIPLYTVGVFIAFTLSQSGMVKHWWKRRASERGWSRRAFVNGLGAFTTGVVALQVGISKFLLGAWVVLLLIPLLIAMMLFIRRQYQSSAEQLAVKPGVPLPGPHRDERVIVPVPGINRAVVQAINVGRSIAPDVQAVLVSDEPDEANKIRDNWRVQLPDVPLVVVESPYRALVAPLLAYLDVLDQIGNGNGDRDAPITFVVIPEFVARSWWERILYNQSARRLRQALLGRRHTVVVNVPYRREDPDKEAEKAATAPAA